MTRTIAQHAFESYMLLTASARRFHDRAVSHAVSRPDLAAHFQKISAEAYARAGVAREMFAIHRRDK